MRVAGIRLADRSVVWAEAGSLRLAAPDRVLVRLPGGDVTGEVFVAPEQLIEPVSTATGVVVEVIPRSARETGCGDLPGAEMPPLGTRLRTSRGEGTVTRVDAVQRRLVVTGDDGEEREFSLDEVEPEVSS